MQWCRLDSTMLNALIFSIPDVCPASGNLTCWIGTQKINFDELKCNIMHIEEDVDPITLLSIQQCSHGHDQPIPIGMWFRRIRRSIFMSMPVHKDTRHQIHKQKSRCEWRCMHTLQPFVIDTDHIALINWINEVFLAKVGITISCVISSPPCFHK